VAAAAEGAGGAGVLKVQESSPTGVTELTSWEQRQTQLDGGGGGGGGGGGEGGVGAGGDLGGHCHPVGTACRPASRSQVRVRVRVRV